MIIRTPPKITNRQQMINYIEVDLWSWLKQLATGILKINFTENFQTFTVQNLEIDAGQEVAIANAFNDYYPGSIPSGYLIMRQRGDAHIIDGDQPWTKSQVFLKNPSANNAVVTVIFFL